MFYKVFYLCNPVIFTFAFDFFLNDIYISFNFFIVENNAAKGGNSGILVIHINCSRYSQTAFQKFFLSFNSLQCTRLLTVPYTCQS